jgi:hypothetical protein
MSAPTPLQAAEATGHHLAGVVFPLGCHPLA